MNRKEQMRLFLTAAGGALAGGVAFLLFGKKKPTAEATVVVPGGEADRTNVREETPVVNEPATTPITTGGGVRAGGARTAIPPLADSSLMTRLGIRPMPRGLTPASFPTEPASSGGTPPVTEGPSWEELILSPMAQDGELVGFWTEVSYPHRYWIAIARNAAINPDAVRAHLEEVGFQVNRVMLQLPLIQTDVPAYDSGDAIRFDVRYVRQDPSRLELAPGSRVWRWVGAEPYPWNLAS